MKRRPLADAPADPFLGWGALALKTAEMMLASAHVISHRASRVNDPVQLLGMASEKAQAAMLASQAMARHWIGMGSRAPSPAQWAEWLASGLAPFHAKALANSKRAARRK